MTPEQALAWLAANPDTVVTLVVVLLGGFESLRRYRETGRFPLQDLPWRAIRRLVYTVRRQWFQYPKPEKRMETVSLPIETIRDRLGSQSYEPAWPLSLHYSGEDLNCRRYIHRPGAEYPHRQIHIRGWEQGDLTELYAHEEPSALHHPKVHLQSSDMEDATAWVANGIHDDDALNPRLFYGRR